MSRIVPVIVIEIYEKKKKKIWCSLLVEENARIKYCLAARGFQIFKYLRVRALFRNLPPLDSPKFPFPSFRWPIRSNDLRHSTSPRPRDFPTYLSQSKRLYRPSSNIDQFLQPVNGTITMLVCVLNIWVWEFTTETMERHPSATSHSFGLFRLYWFDRTNY